MTFVDVLGAQEEIPLEIDPANPFAFIILGATIDIQHMSTVAHKILMLDVLSVVAGMRGCLGILN